MQGGEEVTRWVAIRATPHPLVARLAGAAGEPAGELPDDPVAGFDQVVRFRVQVGGFVQELPRLGQQPFPEIADVVDGVPDCLKRDVGLAFGAGDDDARGD